MNFDFRFWVDKHIHVVSTGDFKEISKRNHRNCEVWEIWSRSRPPSTKCMRTSSAGYKASFGPVMNGFRFGAQISSKWTFRKSSRQNSSRFQSLQSEFRSSHKGGFRFVTQISSKWTKSCSRPETDFLLEISVTKHQNLTKILKSKSWKSEVEVDSLIRKNEKSLKQSAKSCYEWSIRRKSELKVTII